MSLRHGWYGVGSALRWTFEKCIHCSQYSAAIFFKLPKRKNFKTLKTLKTEEPASKEKWYFWVPISKNHHTRTWVTLEIDLRGVWPPRLLLRTIFVSKIISNTNNEVYRCVEKFFGLLEHHQVVFKNSLLEVFQRKSRIFGYQFQKITIHERWWP